MDINTFTAAATRVLDQEFSRVSDNLRNGWITPALASLLFEQGRKFIANPRGL